MVATEVRINHATHLVWRSFRQWQCPSICLSVCRHHLCL